jgi:hypothetical protein
VNILDENVPGNQRQLLLSWSRSMKSPFSCAASRGTQGSIPRPSEWAQSLLSHIRAYLSGAGTPSTSA